MITSICIIYTGKNLCYFAQGEKVQFLGQIIMSAPTNHINRLHIIATEITIIEQCLMGESKKMFKEKKGPQSDFVIFVVVVVHSWEQRCCCCCEDG